MKRLRGKHFLHALFALVMFTHAVAGSFHLSIAQARVGVLAAGGLDGEIVICSNGMLITVRLADLKGGTNTPSSEAGSELPCFLCPALAKSLGPAVPGTPVLQPCRIPTLAANPAGDHRPAAIAVRSQAIRAPPA